MPHVLLVDDSAVDRVLFSGMLAKEASFAVTALNSGREALRQLEECDAALVITDMQMPEMDGLELVTTIRRKHPRVPVILITGHGSEALAAKALKAGAAGYVPKIHAHQLLSETARHVIDLAQAAGDYERLLGASNHVHFDFEIGSDLSLVGALQDLTQRIAGAMEICDSTRALQIGVALEHAIENAVCHGVLELSAENIAELHAANGRGLAWLDERRSAPPYCERSASVSLDVTRDDLQIVVTDSGRGFDVQKRTSGGLTRSLTSGTGRGLFLMWAFMDKVTFDRGGTRVTLIKHREKSEPIVSASSAAMVAQTLLPTSTTPSSPAPPAATDTAPTATATTASTAKLGELVCRASGKVYALTKRRITVGRQESCDLVIHHGRISQHHCLLCLQDGWWFVKDLHSTNGTKVDDVAISEHLLRPGNILTLGSEAFEIRYQPFELGAMGITPPPMPF